MAISASEYVLWAYRLLLGREPETPEATESWSEEATREEILQEFLSSAEFLARHSPRAWMGAMRDFWFITELPNGARMWVRADDEHVSRAVIAGTYEPIETAFVRRYVRRGMNAVDIGAGIGWFTVNMAALVGPAGHVDAFEPREGIAHYLQRSVAENRFSNVSVHRCALSSEDGFGIYVPDRDGDDGAIRPSTGDALPGAAAQRVPLRRLESAVWGSVHFIRLAAAGAEKLVLDGAELILSRDRPLILSKIDDQRLRHASGISASDLVRFFEGIDYEVRSLLPGGRCGKPVIGREIDGPGGHSVACLPAEKAAEMVSERRP